MKIPKVSGKDVLLWSIPICAVVMVGLTLLLRRERYDPRDRERESLKAYMDDQAKLRAINPAACLNVLRKAQQGVTGGSSDGPITARDAKEDLVRVGDTALPLLKKSILDPNEPPLFRMELIALLGEMGNPKAWGLLEEIFADRTLEERYRAVALSKLTGRESSSFFQALKKVYSEEPSYGSRHLLLKAVGESRNPEGTPILIEASRKDPSPSARIQAVESLGTRMAEPGVMAAVKEVLYNDSSENARIAAVGALGKSSDPAAGALLQEIARDPNISAPLRAAAENWMKERARKK